VIRNSILHELLFLVSSDAVAMNATGNLTVKPITLLIEEAARNYN
jgi:hypothetical protein